MKTSNQLTIAKINETYNVILTNDSYTFVTNSSRIVTSTQSTYTDIKIYRGEEEITDFTIGAISGANGITVSQTATRITFSVTENDTISVDNGTFVIPVIVDGTTYNKTFSWACAKQGASGESGVGYTVMLSNESHQFVGNTSTAIAGATSTDVIAWKNSSQVATTITKIGSSAVSGDATVETGIAGLMAVVSNNGTTDTTISFNASTSLTTKNGTIEIAITVDNKSFTKEFSYSLALSGSAGESARTYILDVDTVAIKKGENDTFIPATVTFSGFYRDGKSATRTAYSGRFIIQESTDGSAFVEKYISSANESTKTYTPSSSDVQIIKCTLYASGGTTSALDTQSVVVLLDTDSVLVGGRNFIRNSRNLIYDYYHFGSILKISSFTATLKGSLTTSPQLQGTTLSLACKAHGGAGTLQYRFRRVKHSTSVETTFKDWTTSSSTACNPAAGTYTIYVDVKDENETIDTASMEFTWVTMKINSFTANSASPQIIGKSITLTVDVEGVNELQYKFYRVFNGTTYIFRDYSTENTTICNPIGTGAGTYTLYVDVKDTTTGSVETAEMEYVWKPEFKITSQPVDYTGAVGTNATFALTATGENLVYQWQYQSAGSDTWENSTQTGSQTDTLSVPITEARNGQMYRCIVTDGNGNTLTSNEVTLTVSTS